MSEEVEDPMGTLGQASTLSEQLLKFIDSEGFLVLVPGIGQERMQLREVLLGNTDCEGS